MIYLSNAFSLNMVTPPVVLTVRDVDPSKVPASAVSVVGHQSTTEILSRMLRRPVAFNRVAVQLNPGDTLYVAALFKDGRPYRGPEGREMFVEDFARIEVRMRAVQVRRK